jgi:hypothetical protein
MKWTDLTARQWGYVLMFIVCAISKQLIILNEELLVLVCFIAFVYTVVKYFQSSIGEIFTARSTAIEQELSSSMKENKASLESAVKALKAAESHTSLMKGLRAQGSLGNANSMKANHKTNFWKNRAQTLDTLPASVHNKIKADLLANLIKGGERK